MLKVINKFIRLPFTEQMHLLKAFVLLAFFKVALKIFPIKKVNVCFNWFMSKSTNENVNQNQIEGTGLAIKRVVYTLPHLGFTCLPQTLAFKYLLRHDAEINIMIGVQRDQNAQFVAHAWAEKNHTIIFGEQADLNYVPIWNWKVKKNETPGTPSVSKIPNSLSY